MTKQTDARPPQAARAAQLRAVTNEERRARIRRLDRLIVLFVAVAVVASLVVAAAVVFVVVHFIRKAW